MSDQSIYSIELSENLKSFLCDDCGKESLTVWGWVSRKEVAHAVYYAGLMIGHDEASVRLTISIGGWGLPDGVSVRRWCFIEVRPTDDSFAMMVRQPEESLYFKEAILGRAMSRDEVLASPLRNEFFSVADFVGFNDPAVRSYLAGDQVSRAGRKEAVH